MHWIDKHFSSLFFLSSPIYQLVTLQTLRGGDPLVGVHKTKLQVVKTSPT